MLKGKNVLLGVTGGIAAYKACELASALVKQHADVNVIMTKNATEFVAPLTFDALTHNRTVTDTFDRMHSYEIEHISLAEKADVIVIAPASANVIAKPQRGCGNPPVGNAVCNNRKVLLLFVGLPRPKGLAMTANTYGSQLNRLLLELQAE